VEFVFKGARDQVLKDQYLDSEISDWRTLWIFIWRECGCSIHTCHNQSKQDHAWDFGKVL